MDVYLDKRGHRVVGECCVWFHEEWQSVRVLLCNLNTTILN